MCIEMCIESILELANVPLLLALWLVVLFPSPSPGGEDKKSLLCQQLKQLPI